MIAAIQMVAEFANVDKNLKIAERLATQAFNEGAEWVILPEFFTSAMSYHEKMLDVVRSIDGRPMQLLKKLALKHNGIIGGSYIAYRDGDSYNTFVLTFPDGDTHFHDKDQPTMWENCYYIGGKDDGILKTRVGNIGVALCWEFVRTRTVKRMLNHVDLVVGGSCWWTTPKRELAGLSKDVHERNLEIMINTPSKFAKLLGVPVVHAAHAGVFEGEMPAAPNIPYNSFYLGETQIVNSKGKILARMKREEGDGFIMKNIDFTKKSIPSETIPDRFWIPELPQELIFSWDFMNDFGKKYYLKKTKKYRENHKLLD